MPEFQNYIITATSLEAEDQDEKRKFKAEATARKLKEMEKYTEMLLDGFDPLGSPKDRRILFDTTGIRLDPDDFRGSSSDEDSGTLQPKVKYGKRNTAIHPNHVI